MLPSGAIPAELLLATERWCYLGQHFVSVLRFHGPIAVRGKRRGSECADCWRAAKRSRYAEQRRRAA